MAPLAQAICHQQVSPHPPPAFPGEEGDSVLPTQPHTSTMFSCWLSYGDNSWQGGSTVTSMEERLAWGRALGPITRSYWYSVDGKSLSPAKKGRNSPRIAFPTASSSHSFQMTLISISLTTLCTTFAAASESSGQPQAPLNIPAGSRKRCWWLAVRS